MYWKKWAAKHEYEELKEGAWLEPGLALLRKKVSENWTDKHRNVARMVFLEGGSCQACKKEERTEKHRLFHCPEWCEVRREIPEVFRKLEQKARTSKKEWKWQRGIVEHPLSGIKWNRGLQHEKIGVGEAQELEHASTRATSPLTAPCWRKMASGEHVVGQWYMWTTMKRWGHCMACMPQWRQNWRFSAL